MNAVRRRRNTAALNFLTVALGFFALIVMALCPPLIPLGAVAALVMWRTARRNRPTPHRTADERRAAQYAGGVRR